MTLIDTERAEELYAAMSSGIEASGGSAGNTVAGVASFGGRAAYMGRVFDDQLGAIYAHDMKAQGVLFANPPATEGPPTGRSLIVVTRRPPHHEHLPGGVGLLLPVRRGPRPDRLGPGHVPRGLPVRPARVAGGVLDGVRLRHRRRPQGGAHPVRPVLRGAPPRRVPAAGARAGRHPLRQRGRGLRPVGLRRGRGRGRAGPGRGVGGLHHPVGEGLGGGGGARDLRGPAHPVEVVDTTGAGDLYAPGSCSATRRAGRCRSAASWARWPPPR